MVDWALEGLHEELLPVRAEAEEAALNLDLDSLFLLPV
jgi:hypothetical protein